MRDCRARGVQIAHKEISSFESLYDRHRIIINCAGLGARQLVVDKELKPARGVTVRVAAPWIKQFVICSEMPHHPKDTFAHIFPRLNVAVVGGLKQVGNEKNYTDEDEVKR